ncbi:hypothetical protein Rhopal_002287-T1 [Rhodotorula paludigena]|uniref:Allergen n=1 Tax=Rhodotorula paludigena TaxID=86838 RepID=A0AAV5GIZ8_9BASI|nr:hypothetical protein Rhopal_002287-T1 [Rhodotorula paludigena]
MDKIKQVFSHDKSTDSSNPNTTDNSGIASNSRNVTETPTHSAAGDRSSVPTDRSTDLDSSAKPGVDRERSGLTDTRTESNAGPATTAAAATPGASHIHEHAEAPRHHHNQPHQDGLLDEAGAKKATHDHQHLAPVTHETHHHHEVEEVERQREVDRHVHHVQHHTQPVLDTQHSAEVQHEKSVPVTHVRENHVATDEDKAQFASLGHAHDSKVEAPRERTIIDRGEKVHENTHHHVHHVVQPEIERDTHEHHRIKTTIPVHQETHEAPIVHESVAHEPLNIKDFTANGGDLSSKLKHDHNLLNRGECERTVDGPAESLTQSLGLGGQTTGTTTGGTSATNARNI